MKIADYLIDQEGKDWNSLISGWSFLLPSSFTIWMVNLLGDLIIVSENGEVSFVDVGIGTSEVIAKSRDEFIEIVDHDDNADNWFAIPLVDECKSIGKYLSNNECYSFKVPPILGGEFKPDNVEPTDLSVHYHLLSQIHNQTKDLPDGTKVKINIDESS